MKRYDIGAGIAESGRIRLEVCADPQGDWVKWEDVPGLTVKGQRIPDTVQEWQYLAELYAQQIEADKLTIAQLKQRINKLEQRGSHTKPSLGQ